MGVTTDIPVQPQCWRQCCIMLFSPQRLKNHVNLDRLRDAVTAFRFVLSGDAVVVNARIEGKLDLTETDRHLVRGGMIVPHGAPDPETDTDEEA